MDKLLQSAAKPQSYFEEGSQTIPEGSTLFDGKNNGSGCPLAHNGEGDDIVGNKKFLNFINKALLKFPDKFDYSKVVYVNAKTHVTIICKEHGEFLQTPDKHLQATYPCPVCNQNSRSVRQKGIQIGNKHRLKSYDQFLKEANIKYNNRFKYRLDEPWDGYINSNIVVICPIHGESTEKVTNHLQRQRTNGCIKCANQIRKNSNTDLYEDTINRFKVLYNNFYEYPIENKIIYENKQTKIKIICPIHGEFIKSSQKHLSHQGCPKCKLEELITSGKLVGGYCEEIFKDNIELQNLNAFLYYFKINNGKYYKIGISINNPKLRLSNLKSKAKTLGKIIEIEIIKVKKMTLYEAYVEEQNILTLFKDNRVYEKWSTELFNIDINF